MDVRSSEELRRSRIVLDGAIVMLSRPAGSPGPAFTVMLIADGVEVAACQSVNAAGDLAREYGAWGGPRRIGIRS